jgi:hypothetical protein
VHEPEDGESGDPDRAWKAQLEELARRGEAADDRSAMAERHEAGPALPAFLRVGLPGLFVMLVFTQAATNPQLFASAGLIKLAIFSVAIVLAHRLLFSDVATDARRGALLLAERLAAAALLLALVALRRSLVLQHGWRIVLTALAVLLLLGPFVGWRRFRARLSRAGMRAADG